MNNIMFLPARKVLIITFCMMVVCSPGYNQAGKLIEKQNTGSEIWQITNGDSWETNIYNEVPFCSRESSHFVYLRRNSGSSLNGYQLVRVEMGSWKQEVLDVTNNSRGIAITREGILYYWKNTQQDDNHLMRADLSKGDTESAYKLDGGISIRSQGTVTSDNRYYAVGINLSGTEQNFGIFLIDMLEGHHEIADTDPYIFNPHPQFEPGEGKLLLVQENRGGIILPSGGFEQLTGPEGAIYYLLSIPDGGRTYLPTGIPYITSKPTGHASWVADTKEIVLSVNLGVDYTTETGNLLGVNVDGSIRTLAPGHRVNHVNVSRCGRLFCCDDVNQNGYLVVGSVKTGKTFVLCDPKNSMGGTSSQQTHSHAYLTPDLRWVIYQSDRSGSTHLYAASVPEELLASIMDPGEARKGK